MAAASPSIAWQRCNDSDQVMANRLARARLLTMDGYGHTALLNPSSCVNRIESRYFIKGTVPRKGTRCVQDDEPFAGSIGAGIK